MIGQRGHVDAGVADQGVEGGRVAVAVGQVGVVVQVGVHEDRSGEQARDPRGAEVVVVVQRKGGKVGEGLGEHHGTCTHGGGGSQEAAAGERHQVTVPPHGSPTRARGDGSMTPA